MPQLKRKTAKLKASPKAQSERFIRAARDAECSEDEAVFDENLKRIATTRSKPKPEKTKPD